MPAPPQGTLTFLFTDIVGSTRLWEAFPQHMGPALQHHDALMREAVSQHAGHVFKTVGDAFCAAFATPRDALHAAIHAQRALTTTSWGELGSLRVRMGIHSGTAEFRDGDYFGGTLNRVARIEAAAHGGQILLSQMAHGLLEDERFEDIAFKSLGNHRLRNLDRPEQLFQAVVAGLEDTFPPPRSLEVLPNNLPSQASSFVGREREIEEVKRRIESTRLLTLLGTGGTGKTRLALEIGAQLIQNFQDGVWLVEFALIAAEGQVIETVASTLNVRGEPGRPLRATLVEFLRAKELLLILDNCEHLLAATSALVGELLRTCPKLKILATSRHNLAIAGETTFPVPPLTIFDVRLVELSGPDIAARLSQFEAVKLFIDRATAVRPDFVVTNANAPALAEICSRLDGIPLAIELAAARARVLELSQIAERLDDRFRLLRTGGAGRLPHQQTLQALIDWSHDLLSEPERVLFRRMGVFIGGRTLEALEVVCGGDGIENWELLDLLQQLVDKSLVTVERDAVGLPRYTMIESVWHYAREKLEAAGELDTLRNRHVAYFLTFAESAATHLEGPQQKEWLDRCQREIFNFRFAWEWCIRSRQVESGYRLIGTLWRFIEVRTNLEDARDAVRQLLALDATGVSPQRRAALHLAAGRFAWAADRDDEARQFYLEAQRIHDSIGEEAGAAKAGALQAFLDCTEGKVEAAEARFQRAVECGRAQGQPLLEAMGLIGLGRVALERDDLTTARELHEAGLAVYQRQGDLWMIALILWGLSRVTIAQRDFQRARSALDEWARISQTLGNRWVLPFILDCHAELALELGETTQAARLFGAAEALRVERGTRLTSLDQEIRDTALNRLRSILSQAEFDEAWESGRTASPHDLLPRA